MADTDSLDRPTILDLAMQEPWWRDACIGLQAQHSHDLIDWALRVAAVYGKSGTLEITALVCSLLDHARSLESQLAETRELAMWVADTYTIEGREIWWRNWDAADETKRRRMYVGLAEAQ